MSRIYSRQERKRKQQRRRRVAVAGGILLCLLLCGLFLYRAGLQYRKSQYPCKYAETVEEQCTAYDLPPSLVYAVIKAESNFSAQAVSHAGAMGLMQLTPDTFAWMQTKVKDGKTYTDEDLFDPTVNITHGCALLRVLIDYFGNVHTALCAYNAGIGTVSGWLKDARYSADGVTLQEIPYAETKNYVSKVLRYQQTYQNLYEGKEF